MRKQLSVERKNLLIMLDSQSMTDESYDILDELESAGLIDKLTTGSVNTFVFYYQNDTLRVAVSNLKMDTYLSRFDEDSPYIKL